MSIPTIPPYLGSWEELIDALMHNPFLGGGGGPRHPPRVQAMLRPGSQPDPGLAAEPTPVPWRTALATLIALVGTRQVASNLADDRLKSEMTSDVDRAILDVIDDWCGTRPRPWPPRPPGPHPDTATLIAALGIAAHTIGDGGMREDVLRVAGQVVQRASAATARRERKLPTPDEIDAMGEFPVPNAECRVLCEELQNIVDDLDGATGTMRLRLLARLRAIGAQMRRLNCPPCFLE